MKYIFIDSNQYRHLFSKTEGFSEEVYRLLILLLDKGRIGLLLPQQTKEEIERGRLRKWPEEEIKRIENKIEEKKKNQKEIKEKYGAYESSGDLIEEIEKEISRLELEKENIKESFKSNESKSNTKLKELINRAENIEETEDIIEKAKLRHQKGNPPLDQKIGDALIWESLLEFLRKKREVSLEDSIDLIFVANDQKAWGIEEFDRWLENEYRERVGGKIFYSNKLSDIQVFTTYELEKEIEELKKKLAKKEMEEAKRNAIIDFIASPSFREAGDRAKNLLQYKGLLTPKDYKEIIRGSLSNPQIYQSFFVQPYLADLVAGENGYVVKEVESIEEELWREFKERYDVNLERQSD